MLKCKIRIHLRHPFGPMCVQYNSTKPGMNRRYSYMGLSRILGCSYIPKTSIIPVYQPLPRPPPPPTPATKKEKVRLWGSAHMFMQQIFLPCTAFAKAQNVARGSLPRTSAPSVIAVNTPTPPLGRQITDALTRAGPDGSRFRAQGLGFRV